MVRLFTTAFNRQCNQFSKLIINFIYSNEFLRAKSKILIYSIIFLELKVIQNFNLFFIYLYTVLSNYSYHTFELYGDWNTVFVLLIEQVKYIWKGRCQISALCRLSSIEETEIPIKLLLLCWFFLIPQKSTYSDEYCFI